MYSDLSLSKYGSQVFGPWPDICGLYNSKHARRLSVMKCCQASSRIRWLNGEKPPFREHRNVGLLDSQTLDMAASPNIFCRICKFNFLNDLYRVIHLKLCPVQKSLSCFFTKYRAHRTCCKCPLDLSTSTSLNDYVSRDKFNKFCAKGQHSIQTHTSVRWKRNNLKTCRLSVYAMSFSIFESVIYCS